MTNLRKSIFVALAVIGIGSTTLAAQAQAQDSRPAGAAQQAGEQRGYQRDPAARQARWAKRAERAAARRQKLHDTLMLTAAQEGAWTSYVAATSPGMTGQRGEGVMGRTALRARP